MTEVEANLAHGGAGNIVNVLLTVYLLSHFALLEEFLRATAALPMGMSNLQGQLELTISFYNILYFCQLPVLPEPAFLA